MKRPWLFIFSLLLVVVAWFLVQYLNQKKLQTTVPLALDSQFQVRQIPEVLKESPKARVVFEKFCGICNVL